MSDPTGFRAVIQNQETIGLDQLVDDIVAEGTGLTRPQALAYNEKLFQLIEQYVTAGYRVSLPIVTFKPSIKGVFNGQDDSFDSSRHRVAIHTSPGKRIRKTEKDIIPEKKKKKMPVPEPMVFTDIASDVKNLTATPGNIATLQGYNLKFDPADKETGVFFIPEDRPGSRIRAEQYSSIKPSALHFLVPALKPGNYRLEVKAILPGSKRPRYGPLNGYITVN